jgi:hypothetical protein
MSKRVFKSKKKLSGGPSVYRPWKDWEFGDLIIGTYKGSRTDKYGNPSWLIDVVDAQFISGKDAKKVIGKTIGLNSAGQLNKAMAKVEEGEMVQIMYNGSAQIEGGKYKGKDAHLIEVDLVVEEGDDEEDNEDEDL